MDDLRKSQDSSLENIFLSLTEEVILMRKFFSLLKLQIKAQYGFSSLYYMKNDKRLYGKLLNRSGSPSWSRRTFGLQLFDVSPYK